MKIALVHDFLKEYGGAERVLEALHEVWPKAPIYTAFIDYAGLGPHGERIRKWNIKTSWAQSIPFISKLYSPLRFLAPFFFRSLDLSGFDVVISSTNAYYAKGVIKQGAIHICYCHTPPRSLYGYKTAMDWQKNPFVRIYGTIINHFLRIYDFKAAQGVDYFIANSREVKQRIKKFYRREAVVIYPPVSSVIARSEATWQSKKIATPRKGGARDDKEKGYYLYVGKLAYAKHVDLAIAAANRLKIPLKIVGKGGEEVRLRRLAGPTIEFLGEVADSELYKLYVQCRAVIFPAEDEDFGIVPVEAMAAGAPVIAHRSGGVVESIIESKTGVFFDNLSVDSLVKTIKQFNNPPAGEAGLTIDPNDCIKQAQKFSKEKFIQETKKFVNKIYEKKN